MLFRRNVINTRAFEEASGWTFKPEGACKGATCIPLKNPPGDTLDVEDIAAQMGLPVVKDKTHGLIAVGPESIGAKALTTAEAPRLVLPGLDGQPFDLASLLGKKVLIYAWAPY